MAQLLSSFTIVALVLLCVSRIGAQAPVVICPDISTVGCDFLNNPASVIDPACTDPPNEMLTVVQQGTTCNRVDLYSFTVVDCMGRAASCQFDVARNMGNRPPLIQTPVDARVPLSGELACGTDTSSNALGIPRFRDDCDGAIQGQEDNVQTDDGCVTTIMRTFTGRDSCGDTTTVEQLILVKTDSDPPMVNAPANTVYIGDVGNLPAPGPIVGDVSCSDPCSATTSTFSDQMISTNPVVVRRTFTCTDECGNEGFGSQDITVQPPASPVAPTAISGDPHFRGFLGQKYDFHGTPDAVFNLITSQDLQVNSLFLESDLIKRTTLKTYMGTIGIEHAGARIEVGCVREEAERYIRFNGKDMQPGKHVKFGNATFKLTHADNARSVFTTPTLQLSIRFSASTYSSCHLNLRAKLFAKPPVPFHGVLGQTANVAKRDLVGEGDQGVGVVDGSWEDYRLMSKNVFGKDFVYNLFTGERVNYDALEPLLDLDPAWGD